MDSFAVIRSPLNVPRRPSSTTVATRACSAASWTEPRAVQHEDREEQPHPVRRLHPQQDRQQAGHRQVQDDEQRPAPHPVRERAEQRPEEHGRPGEGGQGRQTVGARG
ncbi:hypothetical protein STANM309S_00043 [Streptomyces tanashiensis]